MKKAGLLIAMILCLSACSAFQGSSTNAGSHTITITADYGSHYKTEDGFTIVSELSAYSDAEYKNEISLDEETTEGDQTVYRFASDQELDRIYLVSPVIAVEQSSDEISISADGENTDDTVPFAIENVSVQKDKSTSSAADQDASYSVSVTFTSSSGLYPAGMTLVSDGKYDQGTTTMNFEPIAVGEDHLTEYSVQFPVADSEEEANQILKNASFTCNKLYRFESADSDVFSCKDNIEVCVVKTTIK